MPTPRLSAADLAAALPYTAAALTVDGSDGPIEVLRDPYGIPHVKAGSVRDAFFGQGFATSQDRLWHMDSDRRLAYGRRAELLGKATLGQDIVMRRLQIRQSAEADYEAANAETKAMLDAYAAGVNAFIETARSLPVEYVLVGGRPEPWQPWDCLAVFKARHVLMGVFEGKLWRAKLVDRFGPARAAEILPGAREGELLIVPPGAEYDGPDGGDLSELLAGVGPISWLDDAESGSNSWVLAGDRTASGKPLLAGDPHRGLEVPNVYYQNHVACPEFDAIGLSFPGCPGFPHFGHNAQVAWCVTHAQADYQDLYVERFKDGLYETEDGWVEPDVRHEVIGVRGGDPVELDAVVTRHGPVIVGGPDAGRGIAFKYTATAGPNPGMRCLPRMLRAESVAEMDEAMRDWVDPANNFMFADVHGGIGYLCRGRLPVRPAANAWLPVPGWDGQHEWSGFVPFEEAPRERDPEAGYIVTANNRIAGDGYPHYIGLHFSPEFRARRIAHRLSTLSKASVEDMAAIHGEAVSIPARSYTRLLSRVDPSDELSAEARMRLLAWDGTMDKDLVAPSIYASFRMRLDLTLLRHVLGPLTDEALAATGRGAPIHVRMLMVHFVDLSERDDTSMLPPGYDWRSLAARALSEGVADLRERLGDDIDAWTWGKLHFTKPRHELSDIFPEAASLLDPPSVPMSGDGDTPHQSGFKLSQPFTPTDVSVARYVFDLSDWNNSRWVTPLGASGHPGSPHYADQVPTWGAVEMLPMLYEGWGLGTRD